MCDPITVLCLQRCYGKDSITNKEDTDMQKVKGSIGHVPEAEGTLCWKYPDDSLLGSLWSPLLNISSLLLKCADKGIPHLVSLTCIYKYGLYKFFIHSAFTAEYVLSVVWKCVSTLDPYIWFSCPV